LGIERERVSRQREISSEKITYFRANFSEVDAFGLDPFHFGIATRLLFLADVKKSKEFYKLRLSYIYRRKKIGSGVKLHSHWRSL